MADSWQEYLGQKPSGGQSNQAAPGGFQGAQQDSWSEWTGQAGAAAPSGPIPMEGTYRQWYTGRNLDGTANGWNTQFQQDFQTGITKAYEEGNFYTYFGQADATGVVTWDKAGKDSQGNELNFGDVVADGAKVGNVYEDMDRHTANVMMGEYLIQDGRVKARMNGAGSEEEIAAAWEKEIDKLKIENTGQAEMAPKHAEFAEDVEERVEDDSAVDSWGRAAAGAGGAAALAAPSFAFGPVVGGIVTTGAAIFGGVSSYLNSDSLAYQVARSEETVARAREEGADAYIPTLMKNLAQNFYQLSMSPASNMVMGLADTSALGGDGVGVGDVGGSFYAVDEEGRRLAPGWVQTAEVISRVGDSLLQFGSPLGRSIYTAQMGVQIGGTGIGMIPGIGQWDERRLEMDSIWTDQNGRFDLGTSLAGIGTAGVEFVQLAGFRGLLSSANREAARLAAKTGGPTARQRPGLFKAPAFLENRMSRVGLTDAQKSALSRGTAELETKSGYRFVIDKKTGDLVDGHKMTLSMLAPSEALQSLSAKMLARRDAVKSGQVGARVTSEGLYQHAADLATGERMVQMILVNAFGEGTEEVVQGLLEPVSHQAAIDAEEVMRAGIGGFAAGLGMGGATAMARPTQDRQMFAVAAMAHWHNTQHQEVLTYERWKGMDALQQRALVQSYSKLDRSLDKAAAEKIQEDMGRSVSGGVMGAAALQDFVEKETIASLQSGAVATDAALVIMQLNEAKYDPDSVAMSHHQVLAGQRKRTVGLQEQMNRWRERLAAADEALAKDPTNKEKEDHRQKLVEDLVEFEGIIRWSNELAVVIAEGAKKITAAYRKGDEGEAQGEIDALNDFMRDVYDRQKDDWRGEALSDRDKMQLAKAISRIDTRHPQDTDASWSSFAPVVDSYFAMTGTNGAAAISEVLVKGHRADFDGDKIIEQMQLMLDDEQYINIRSGAQRLGATTTPEIGTPKEENWVIQDLGSAFASTNTAVNQIAVRTHTKLTDWIVDRYAGVIPGKTLMELVNGQDGELIKAMKNNGDVREVVLTFLSERAGADMTELSRTAMSDEYAVVAGKVAYHLQEFQKEYAAITPKPGEPMPATVAPGQYSSEQHRKRAAHAATRGGTMILMLPGSNMFRAFQKLQYNKAKSTAHGTETWGNDDPDFASMVREYQEATSGALDTKLETTRAHDPIAARALALIQAHLESTDNITHDMAILANTMVDRFEFAKNPSTDQMDARGTGEQVTLAQQMLYLSLEEYRKENWPIWNTDPDVKAAYNKLMPLTRPPTQRVEGSTTGNAEMAFVELFSATPLYEILGTSASTLGAQMTVGQKYRELVDMDPRVRRSEKEALKIMGEYLSEMHPEGSFTIPYTLDDVRNERVTAYRAVVDALFSAASTEVSINRTGEDVGKVTGRKASRERRLRKSFYKMHDEVRRVLKELDPKMSWSAQDLADLADQNPDFGRLLYAAIPRHLMPIVYKGEDTNGQPHYASWYFELFTAESAKAAEMSLMRNVWMDGWRAVQQQLELDTEDDAGTPKSEGVKYHKLKSRMHRVMFRLATDSTGDPFLLQEFIEKLGNATDLDTFMAWANSQPYYTAGKAPLMGWLDETAEFDPERAGSGWTSASDLPQIMENFDALRQGADRLVDGVQEMKDAEQDMLVYAAAIERWHKHLQGKKVKLDASDQIYYDRFMNAVKLAKTRNLVYGPRAMMVTVTNAVHGLYGTAHDKGANPEHLAAQEALEVRNGHFAFAVNFDRIMGDLTSYDERDVANNARLIMQGGGRLQTKHGQQVEWEDQAVERLLPLMRDPKQHQLFNNLLQPQAVELDINNRASTKMMFGHSPTELMNGSYYQDLFSDSGRLSAEQAFKFLGMLESLNRGNGDPESDPFTVQHKIFELAIARTTALDHEATYAELQQLVIEAAVDLATFLQAAVRTRKDPKTGEDPAHNAHHALRVARRMAAGAEILNVDPKDWLSIGLMEQTLRDQVGKKYDDIIRAATDAEYEASQRGDTAGELQAEQWRIHNETLQDAENKRLDAMFGMDIHADIRDQYIFTPKMDDGAKRAKTVVLTDYVANNHELIQGAGPAFQAVAAIRAWQNQPASWRKDNPLNISDKEMEQLSYVIISVELQKLVQVGMPTNPPPPYPKASDGNKLDKSKYYEFDFGYLIDVISPKAMDRLLEVGRDMAVTAGKISNDVTEAQLIDIANRTVFKDHSLGRWTEAIPAQNIEAYDLISGASGKPPVAMAGKLGEKHGAVIHATQRTFQPVDMKRLSKTVVDWEDLNWEDLPKLKNGQPHPKGNLYHGVKVRHPNGQEVERPFVQLNNRFARSVVLTYTDKTGQQTVDLSDEWSVARPFARAHTDQSIVDQGLREIHMSRLLTWVGANVPAEARDSVKVEIEFVHPDMQETGSYDTDGSKPKGRSHYNSLWHEGTVFASNGDYSFSLLGSLFFGGDGINATVQRAALDTRKKGLIGLETYQRPDKADVKEWETQVAKTDWAQMLIEKTNLVMQTPLTGGEPLHEDFYNGVYKMMKLSHWLVGRDAAGNATRWTSEQVIEWQQANPGVDVFGDQGPLKNPKLWLPSTDVLATMMGEKGYGGVYGRLVSSMGTEPDFDTIPAFEGWSKEMEARFPTKPTAKAPDLFATDVAKQSRMAKLYSSFTLDEQRLSRFQTRQENFRIERKGVLAERSRSSVATTFNPKTQMNDMLNFATAALGAHSVYPTLPDNLNWMQMSSEQIAQRTLRDLKTFIANQDVKTSGLGTGWILQHSAPGEVANGILTSTEVRSQKIKSVMPGEIVTVDTNSYMQYDPARARQEAELDADMLAGRGAVVLFINIRGRDDLSHEMREYMRREHSYVRHNDNPMILSPDVMHGRRYQNVAAAESSLTAIKEYTIARQRITVLLEGQRVTENTIWVPIKRNEATRLDTIQTMFNMLPVDVHPRFNVPQTKDQLEHLSRILHGIQGDQAQLDALAEASVGDNKGAQKQFFKQFNTMMAALENRITQGQTTLPLNGEWFGTGDMIPLYDEGRILLYRHGHKYPDKNPETGLEAQLEKTRKTRSGNPIAVYGKQESKATTHRGQVVNTTPSRKFGLRIELDIPVDQIGQKLVYEYNGMKYLQAAMPDSVIVPEWGLARNIPIDGYASLADAMSKEATGGLVVSFQKAFTLLGMDFRQDVADFFGTTQSKAKDILAAIQQSGEKLTTAEITELQDLAAGPNSYMRAISRVAGVFDQMGVPQNTYMTSLYEDTFEATVVRALVLYMMSPGADLDAALSTTGFGVENASAPNAKSHDMPGLFTRVFDLAPANGVVKEELSKRLNANLLAKKITQGKKAGKYEGWFLDVHSWRLISQTEKGAPLVGYLQFGEPHASSDSPTLNDQAFRRKQNQTASIHAALASSNMIGSQVHPDPKKLETMKQLVERRLPPPDQSAKVWEVLTDVDAATFNTGTAWQKALPAEYHHLSNSLDRFVQYRQEIDMSGDDWDSLRTEIASAKQDIISFLGMDASNAAVLDYWVRQVMYRPAPGKDQTNYDDVFWPPHVLNVLEHILDNLRRGYLPIYDGEGPTQLSEPDLRMLYHLARKTGGKWVPWKEEGNPKSPASLDNYGEWVSIAFGQAYNADQTLDPMIGLDQDGFFNTYRDMLNQRGRQMDVSFDKEVQGRLLDDDTNELITVTTSAQEKSRLMETVYLPAQNLSIDHLRRGVDLAQDPVAQAKDIGWRRTARKRSARWRAKNKVRPVARTRGRDYVRHGNKVLDENADMHSLQRIVLALRHGNAMLNPGLYLSMLPEQGFRGMLQQTASVLQGQATSKMAGKATSRMRLNQYTSDQIDAFNDLYSELGSNGAFVASLIGDMMYEQPSPEGMGRVVRATEAYARFGNKWQDPTWGTTQKAMARRYVEALLRAVESTPIRNSMTTDSIIAHLRANPMYFHDKHRDLHDVAVNAVMDARALKQTPISLAVRGIYEPMSRHNNMIVRTLGTILKMNFMYTAYNANVLTTMAGLQGYSQILSVFAEGRKTPGTLLHRAWRAMTRQPQDPADDKHLDMASTLDGYTVANAFIKGGVTHTGLFMLGMLSANGLGLTGEDDEARRRRRLAAMQDAVFIADPRRLEADFRNKDAVFLDWMPPQLSAFFKVSGEDDAQDPRAMVQINWLLKPFINPIIGMERFFQTGDFNEIVVAFGDAIGSLPLFNKDTWSDAVQTARELEALSADQDEVATPTSTKNSLWLLTSAVGILERQLFENMFLNSLYTGMDEYDRDPSKMVLRDSDGDIQRTIENLPRENDRGLTQFVDPDTGEVVTAYMKRDPMEKGLATYTENNATAAAVLSLFTGFQKDLWRTQQAPKLQEIELEQMTKKDAKQILTAALNEVWKDEGGVQRTYSLQEIRAQVKGEAIKAGDWDTYNNIDAIAAELFENPQFNPEWEPMSIVKNGREELTTAGATAVLKGLMGGTVDFDSPALQNISIPRDMRIQIEKEFVADTIQQGIDLGLTQELAEKRATRLLLGPVDDGTVTGFKELLWDKRIPWEAKATYKQLNTTYVQGPDGYPWATGFKRGGFPGMGGFTSMFLGVKKPTIGVHNAIGTDGRMNSVDQVRGINTGLRGLVPMHASELIPTDLEQTEMIIDALGDLTAGGKSPWTPFENNSKSGKGRFWRNYGRGGYRRRGGYSRGYGGNSYAPRINYSRQYSLPRGVNIFGNGVRNIFWDNATIRRSTIRRERVTSQRGRLKQWQ